MADQQHERPAWAPAWAPSSASATYCKTLLELGVLLLAALYIVRQLARGNVHQVAATAAGAAG